MGIKEFSWKTGLFVVLPALLVYTCSREREQEAIGQADCRTCAESLRKPGLTALTLVGFPDSNYAAPNLRRMRITDPAALRQLAVLASKLRPVRVVAGSYRAAPISYEVVVAHGQHTCSMDLYKTQLGPEFFTCPTGSDSAFEVQHLASFADSLFRAALAKP